MTMEAWFMSHEGPFMLVLDKPDTVFGVVCGNCGGQFLGRPSE